MTQSRNDAQRPHDRSAAPSPKLAPVGPVPASPADDLDAIRTAVVDAAGVSAGLWLSYLFALFYLLVAAGGITHRDLLLSNTITLPFLSVQLPLRSFSVLGPAMFVVVHAYVLLHFALLASKIGLFETRLNQEVRDPEVRARLRRQLPINVFVQFLAGPSEVRRGPMSWMLHLIAWMSLVIGPIGLPVYFELQFLPFHEWVVTWVQRATVVIELLLLWTLWPKIVSGTGRWTVRPPMAALMGLGTAISLLIVFAIATFHDEALDRRFAIFSLPHKLFVGGEVDEILRKQKVVWSDRLVLPSFDIIDHARFDSEAKIAAAPEMASLRGRRLDEAVLFHTVLRKVDFTGSDLRRADLLFADLRGANLDATQLQGARLGSTQLQGATFNMENLRGKDLSTRLQGANLASAQLQGASLIDAQLQGANLTHAQLQGANLTGANLTGANLKGANLQAATLDKAQLTSANLDDTQLQGASLVGANLDGASLRKVFAWRTDVSVATMQGARVEAIQTGRMRRCDNRDGPCDWDSAGDDLKTIIQQYVPDGAYKAAAIYRLDQRLDPAKKAQEDDMSRSWVGPQASSPPDAAYEATLQQWWTTAFCPDADAPFVLTAFIDTLLDATTSPLPLDGPQVATLATALSDGRCKEARGLPAPAPERLAALPASPLRSDPAARTP